MISFVAFLAFGGTLFFLIIGAPFLAVHLTAQWWFTEGPGSRRASEVRARSTEDPLRQCMGCPATYHRDWDPPDFTPQRARQDRSWMSGGLCPNCSGAD